jgi:hypothetical protein
MKKQIFSLVVLVMFLGGIAIFAQREAPPPQPGGEEKPIVTEPTKPGLSQKRIREGTAFKGKRVFFRQAGTRTVLYTDENQRFTCLENLTLERVLKAIDETPAHKFWKIDGEFTEFRGENFVLIQRAVVAMDK